MARSLAGNRHCSSMSLDELLDQREADAQSRMCAASSLLLLLEHLKYKRQELRCDALARIANVNHTAIVFSRKRDSDLATGRTEFQRVEQHVPEDLLQAIPVGSHVHGLGVVDEPHCDVFLLGNLGRRFHRAADDVGQAVDLQIERQFATRGAIQLEKVFRPA